MKKKSCEIHIHIHLHGLTVEREAAVGGGVTVIITKPLANDLVPSTFRAEGTVVPKNAFLYGAVSTTSGSLITVPGTLIQGGNPGPWIIEFQNVPTGVPLRLFVFATTGLGTGSSSIPLAGAVPPDDTLDGAESE